MTPPPDFQGRLLLPLHRAGIRYMVTGGVAAIMYGEPRLTNDVGVVLELRIGDADRLAAGFDSARYCVPPVETMREEAARQTGGHFNILDLETSLRADLYCLGADPLGIWAMSHRREVPIGDGSIWMAPIEYVILQKLRYYRESGSDRHLRDIRAMRRISGGLIDQPVLDEWIKRLELEPEWNQALSKRE